MIIVYRLVMGYTLSIYTDHELMETTQDKAGDSVAYKSNCIGYLPPPVTLNRNRGKYRNLG